MAFLEIDEHAIEIQRDGADERVSHVVGFVSSAYDGQLRSSVAGVKREWNLKTIPLTEAEAMDVISAVRPHTRVVVSGEAIGGGTAECVIEIERESFVSIGRGQYRRVLHLHIVEA